MSVSADEEIDLSELDWDLPPINCSGIECTHEGVALVKFRVHDKCQKHKHWYVACQRHLDEATSGQTTCRACRFHLAMTEFKYL